MSYWEGPFQGMDPLTYSVILRMQLEETQGLMYTEDLCKCDTAMLDRKMAQSMATAVLRNGDLIQHAYEQERIFAQDREIAERLAANNKPVRTRTPSSAKQSRRTDPWADEEMLAKVAAIYMRYPGSTEDLVEEASPGPN
ncbi:hypothetical protein B0A54_17525 [Friedmanniomyces endolithicus]|uniref:Uncharacterized protein n=1 Tax=Friedmanniomyces endolithicus TaxID=329885 RepID=A0A4V5N467_9PEZI|nr:hypothetical protein B0A54_17525 [Friedmanniomyces endolithicus]